jgi:excisionase family DNA binding protein
MANTADPLDDLLTITEAAQELEVPEREVRDMLQDGSLRGAKVGGRWVTTVAAVNELADVLDGDEDDDDQGDDDEDDDTDE